jgi:hypothetical protein
LARQKPSVLDDGRRGRRAGSGLEVRSEIPQNACSCGVFERLRRLSRSVRTTGGAAGRFCERSKKENFAWSPSFGRVVTTSRQLFGVRGTGQLRRVVGAFFWPEA